MHRHGRSVGFVGSRPVSGTAPERGPAPTPPVCRRGGSSGVAKGSPSPRGSSARQGARVSPPRRPRPQELRGPADPARHGQAPPPRPRTGIGCDLLRRPRSPRPAERRHVPRAERPGRDRRPGRVARAGRPRRVRGDQRLRLSPDRRPRRARPRRPADRSAPGARVRHGHRRPRQDRPRRCPGACADGPGARPSARHPGQPGPQPAVRCPMSNVRCPQATQAAGRDPQGREDPPPRRRAGRDRPADRGDDWPPRSPDCRAEPRHRPAHRGRPNARHAGPPVGRRARHRPDGRHDASRRVARARHPRPPAHRLSRRPRAPRSRERPVARRPTHPGGRRKVRAAPTIAVARQRPVIRNALPRNGTPFEPDQPHGRPLPRRGRRSRSVPGARPALSTPARAAPAPAPVSGQTGAAGRKGRRRRRRSPPGRTS